MRTVYMRKLMVEFETRFLRYEYKPIVAIAI